MILDLARTSELEKKISELEAKLAQSEKDQAKLKADHDKLKADHDKEKALWAAEKDKLAGDLEAARKAAPAAATAPSGAHQDSAKEIAELKEKHAAELAQERAKHAKALEDDKVKDAAEEKARLDKALAEERAKHEKVLAEEKAKHDKALAEEKAKHDKALAEEKARHEKALAEEKASKPSAAAAAVVAPATPPKPGAAAATAASGGSSSTAEADVKRLTKEKEIMMQKLVDSKTELKTSQNQLEEARKEIATLKAAASAGGAASAAAAAGATRAPSSPAPAPAAAPTPTGKRMSNMDLSAPVVYNPGKSVEGLPFEQLDDGSKVYYPTEAMLDIFGRFIGGDVDVHFKQVYEKFSKVPEQVLLDWMLWMSLHCKRLGKLMALTQVATNALSSMDEMMAKITEDACADIGAERGTIFAADPKRRQLFSMVAMSSKIQEAEVRPKVDSNLKRKYKDRRVINKRQFLEIRIPDDEGIAGHVYSTGEALNIPDAYEDYRFNKDVDKKSGLRTKAVLCVPVSAHGGVRMGVLQVINKKGGGVFDSDQLVRLEALAVKAGIHLYRTAIFAEAREVMKKNALVDTVMSSYMEEVALDKVMATIVEDVKRILECERATVFVIDDVSSELFSLLPDGSEIRFPSTAGLAGECFTKKKPINIPKPYSDPRFNKEMDKKTGFKTRSILCMPLFSRELDPSGKQKIIGVIQALNKV